MLLGQIDINRQRLVKAFYAALDLDVELEKRKQDDWSKQKILELFTRLKDKVKKVEPHMNKIHELITTNQAEPTQDMACDLLWHCCEVVGLSLMVLARVMDKAGLMTK